MRSLLETERAPGPKTGPLYKVQVGPNLAAVSGQGSELDPCLAWVRREQKAAANEARFGAHFTQIVRFSAFFATNNVLLEIARNNMRKMLIVVDLDVRDISRAFEGASDRRVSPKCRERKMELPAQVTSSGFQYLQLQNRIT